MGFLRIRTTVDERPGRLASLTAALAAKGGNILGLSVQPDTDGRFARRSCCVYLRQPDQPSSDIRTRRAADLSAWPVSRVASRDLIARRAQRSAKSVRGGR